MKKNPLILIHSLFLNAHPLLMILKFLTQLFFNTEAKLSSITYEDNDILKSIRNLDVSKAHGFDDISVRMVTLFDFFFVKPLSIIFKNGINSDVFPDGWKKSNIVPIHKKNDKQLINKYRPVSLLPICRKMFERTIFYSFFNLLKKII